MTDDVTRADALRATTCDGIRRRRVLGGVAAAAGAILGLSGTGAAREMESDGADAGSNATCEPGCQPQYFCAEYEDGRCVEWWWYCNCE